MAKKEDLQMIPLESEGDADIDIVKTAIQKSESNSKVIIIGSDTYLSFLLDALSPGNRKIYFKKQKGGKSPSTILL